MTKVKKSEILKRLNRLADRTNSVRLDLENSRLTNEESEMSAVGHCGSGSQD